MVDAKAAKTALGMELSDEAAMALAEELNRLYPHYLRCCAEEGTTPEVEDAFTAGFCWGVKSAAFALGAIDLYEQPKKNPDWS